MENFGLYAHGEKRNIQKQGEAYGSRAARSLILLSAKWALLIRTGIGKLMLPKSKLLVQNTSIVDKNDPKEILELVHDFLRPNFLKNLQWGSLNFGYCPKMVLKKVVDEYIEA